MQTHRLKNAATKPVTHDTMKLDVMLMHEDLPAGLRGKQALDQVAERLELKAAFRMHLWRFELMDEPALRNQAVEDAREANIVVLAIRHCAELPASVREWLDQWLRTRSLVPCAVVVSLDTKVQALPTPHPAVQYLRALSGPAGVDLFQHYADTLPAAWNWSSQKMPVTSSSAWMERAPHVPQLHAAWGIND